jgi:arylsulfatase B
MNGTEPAYDANNPVVRGGQPVVEKAYLTDAFIREALDFIARNKDKPFFLLLAYNAVHSPMQGAGGYMKKFAYIHDVHRRIFGAMLSNMDDIVGAVLAKLRKEHIEKKRYCFSSAITVAQPGNSPLATNRYATERGVFMREA